MPGDVVGGCKERGERTRPRAGVGDARGRKRSDSGKCEGVQQRKEGQSWWQVDDASRGGLQIDKTCVPVGVNLVCDLSIRRGQGSNKPNHSMQGQADRTLGWNTRDEREQLDNREHLTLVSSLPPSLYTHTLHIPTHTHTSLIQPPHVKAAHKRPRNTDFVYCRPPLDTSSTRCRFYPSFLCCTPSHFPESLPFLPFTSLTLTQVLSPLSLQPPTTSPGITFPSHLHPHPTPP